MKAIASGIKELHGCGFIHKDLKASNILLTFNFNDHKASYRLRTGNFNSVKASNILQHCELENYLYLDSRLIDVKIGDYESSDDVVGTGFFRAPEVLRALQDGTKVEYSAAVDVYGFGMVCYELLTEKLPFQGHAMSDYDLVLSGKRPDVSRQPPCMRELLHRCWDDNPHQRPGWDEILQILGEELLVWKENCIPAQRLSTSALNLCRRRRNQAVRRLVMIRTRSLRPQERIQVVRRRRRLLRQEDPSGEETSDDEDKEPTTSGEDPSSKEDEEATTSGGVRPS